MAAITEKIKHIYEEFNDLAFTFDERGVRLWCAARARAYDREYGRGGVMIVHMATGVSRSRIYAGMRDLEMRQTLDGKRIRRPGGGRKKNDRPPARSEGDVRAPDRSGHARRSRILAPVGE